MYATVEDMVQLLPSNIRINDANLGIPSPGKFTDKDGVLTTEQALGFISMAQQEVDARLSPFYLTPLKQIKIFEEALAEDAIAGNNVEIRLWTTAQFSVGDIVRIQSYYALETTVITQVRSSHTFIVDRLKQTFHVENDVTAAVIKYPDPVPLITARLAVSYAFDGLFSAEQSPDISNYGTEQRKLAHNSLDNIMDGSAFLFGQEQTGRRFVRGTLFDNYYNPTSQFQFGREKG
jgi:hypothetical protein